MKLSPEMSFVPSRYPHEIIDKAAGEEQVARINHVLAALGDETGVDLRAKLDPHHGYTFDQIAAGALKGQILSRVGEAIRFPIQTYTVEIVPVDCFYIDWFGGDNWIGMRKALTVLFAYLRRKEGLVPNVRRLNRRTGVETHWPSGGCHQHYDAALFPIGANWYRDMRLFHQNLLISFTNMPAIRWLFSQWFADNGGTLPFVTDSTLLARYISMKPEAVFRLLMTKERSTYIEPRYMSSSKGSYLTFEFRMFSMVDNPDELRLIARVVDKWVRHIQFLTDRRVKLLPELTPRKLADMKDMRKSRRICAEWLDSLGLSWDDYRLFHDRHYANRIRFGQMV